MTKYNCYQQCIGSNTLPQNETFMKKIILILLATLLVTFSFSQVKVKGYYRKDGTYVQPHYRSSPDGNPYNNYSYPGNINPYTGKIAPGNADAYLNSYYNRNSSTSSNSVANYNWSKNQTYRIKSRDYNYSRYSLYSADYYQIAAGYTRYSRYNIRDSYGYEVGYASSNNFRKYKIYDISGNETGKVKVTRAGYYTVYDNDGHKLYSNKPKGLFAAKVLAVIGSAGLLFLLAY